MSFESVINKLKQALQDAGALSESDQLRVKSLTLQANELLVQASCELMELAEKTLSLNQPDNHRLNGALINVREYEACQEELDRQYLACEVDDELEQKKISRLEPSGFTFTDTDLHTIANKIVNYVRSRANGQTLTAHVWPYRYDGDHMLSCDFHSTDSDLIIPLYITALREQSDTPIDEPTVYDLPEALHLAGLVTRALNVEVKIGRYRNETNQAVLARPLKNAETNGQIDLWEENHE